MAVLASRQRQIWAGQLPLRQQERGERQEEREKTLAGAACVGSLWTWTLMMYFVISAMKGKLGYLFVAFAWCVCVCVCVCVKRMV